MSQKPQTVQLSPNWVQVTDPKSGNPYYYHKKTKETVWARPDEKIEQDKAQNGNTKPSNTKKKQPAEDKWLELKHPESGQVYYYNPKKKETSWYRPDQVVSATSDAMKMDSKGAWVERIDPKSGRTFYYNQVLGKTSWHNPDAEEAKPTAKPSALARFSLNFTNRLSMGGNRKSAGISNLPADRNSASFSLATPAMPVNRSSARVSLRLGADNMFEDKFAALRAMQESKPTTTVGASAEKVEGKKPLILNIQEEIEALDLNKIRSTDILEYCQNRLDTRRKGGFFGGKREMAGPKLLSHQKSPLIQPLHPLKDKLMQQDSLLAFKVMLWYCGDKPKKKGKEEQALASEFASFGINTLPEFQNELYVMLMKQATNNPDMHSLEAVWELFALSCGVFKPDADLMPYVLSFLKDHGTAGDMDRIKNLALYALVKLNKVQERLAAPSVQEVASVRAIQPVELRVNLISAPPVTILVESWTTVKEVKEMIESRFSIADGTPFALYEVEGDQDRVLDPSDKILDVLSYWENAGSGFQALYKMRLYFDISEEDTAAIELAYLQAVYEVIDERYPCERIDAVRLAALEAQEKFGDFNDTDVFGEKLGAYIPPKYYVESEAEEMKREIYREYQKMKGTDKLQCMVNYLSYVKRWPYYGSAYFFAKPVQLKILGKEFPETVILGINAKGVLIIDPDGLRQIVEYPYSEIVTWGHSAANFVLVVGNLVRSTKLFFSTVDGNDMNGLIHAYVHKLMEAQTEEEQEEMLLNQFR